MLLLNARAAFEIGVLCGTIASTFDVMERDEESPGETQNGWFSLLFMLLLLAVLPGALPDVAEL